MKQERRERKKYQTDHQTNLSFKPRSRWKHKEEKDIYSDKEQAIQDMKKEERRE